MRHTANAAITISLSIVAFVWAINGVYLAWLSRHNVALFWMADLFQWIVLPLTIVLFLAKRHGVQPRQYGLDVSRLGCREMLWGGVATLTLYAAYFGVEDFAGGLLGNPVGFFVFEEVFPGGVMGTVLWLYASLTAGIVESAFFIGLPWLLWSRKYSAGALWFTLLCSLIFAGVHWEQGPHVVAAALTFNLVACAWYFRLRTLWPVVIGHVIVDLIALSPP